MTIEQTYRTEGGDQYWEVCIAEDRYVTVRRSEGTGNYYIIENPDGSTVRDGSGGFCKGYAYDEYEVIRFVRDHV